MEPKYIETPAYRLAWDEVMDICKAIALEAKADFDPDMVLGVARGGLIPATILACILQVELYPVALTRKFRGHVVRDRPVFLIPVPETVEGRRVLIVDEMVVSGETLLMASQETRKKGARKVRTASLWATLDGWKPDWWGMETAGWIMFPWDYEVVSAGRFVVNPLYEEYLQLL